eukprot:5741710-Prymnesium_polylepis.1
MHALSWQHDTLADEDRARRAQRAGPIKCPPAAQLSLNEEERNEETQNTRLSSNPPRRTPARHPARPSTRPCATRRSSD